MKRETTEHRQVVIAAMLAVAATLMIMMLTAQNAHAAVQPITLGASGTKLAHCGVLPAGASTRDYTKRPRNVRIIQHKLTELGYDVGAPGIDGKFGRFTRGATASFQADYHLATNATVDRATALMLAYASHPSANVRRCKPDHVPDAH